MMRRPLSLLSLISIVSALIMFVVSTGTVSRAQEGTAEASTTPTGIEGPNGIFVEQLWTVEVWESTGPGTPTPDDPGHTYATKVTILAGTDPPSAGHTHAGAIVVTVAEGAICYKSVLVANPSSSVVTANAKGFTPSPNPCGAAAVTDCADTDGCPLEPGEVVYLPAGSWITQSNESDHWYTGANNEQAVVYVTGFAPGDDGAGCNGGCH